MPLDRRRFLRLLGGSLGAAGLGAIAGCSSSCPDDDRPTPEERIAITASPAGAFASRPSKNWRTAHGSAARTGYTTASLPEGGLSVRWRNDIDLPPTERGGLSASAPVVGNGMVVVADSQRVHALSLRTGEIRWQSDLVEPTYHDTLAGHAANTPAPAIGPAGTVFVGSQNGVVALDPADGSVAWEVEDLSAVTSPAVVGNSVFAQGADTLVALKPEGGEWWRQSISRDNPPLPPAVDSSHLVVPTEDGLAGFDPATGDERWRSDRQVETHPVLADGTCFAGNYDGLHGIRAVSGEDQWTVERGDGRAMLSPVVTPETVYAVEQPGEAGAATFALDRTDGEPEPRWCSYIGSGAVTAATSELALGMLSLDEGPTAVRSIVAFSRSLGDSRWAITAGDRPQEWLTPPAVVQGAVIATTRGGRVVAVGGGT